jgi:RNA polymerase sigma-70 factor, ECF subfamily
MTDDPAAARPTENARGGAGARVHDLTLRHVWGLADPARFETSLEYLHKRYARWVERLLKGRGHDAETAKDLTQETFVRVFRGSGKFETVPEFEAWLKQIAINVHRNHVRDQHAVKRNAPEDSLDEWMEEHGHAVPSPPEKPERGVLDRFLDKERRHQVGRALQTLPPAMRRCLVLRIFHEMTYQEIADRVGISIGTVKAHLHQGRDRLSERLAAYFDRDGPTSPGEAGA